MYSNKAKLLVFVALATIFEAQDEQGHGQQTLFRTGASLHWQSSRTLQYVQVLQEEYQVRPNGVKRVRDVPVSEKMKAGESWQVLSSNNVSISSIGY